jgi:hypothetical protein
MTSPRRTPVLPSDTNRVIILDAEGSQQPVDLAHKSRISEMIISRIAGVLGTNTAQLIPFGDQAQPVQRQPRLHRVEAVRQRTDQRGEAARRHDLRMAQFHCASGR